MADDNSSPQSPQTESSSRIWTKNYETGVPPKGDYETACLPFFLDRTASEFPEHTALVFQGYKLSFRQLADMVNGFAAALSDFGLQKGDAVAILLPNVIPCVVSYFAVLKIGGIAVMNNPLYSDRELKHQFNDSGAKALITLDLLANRMIDLRPDTGIEQMIVTSIGDYLPFPKSLLFPLVGKKKGLAASVKPGENVHSWKPLIGSYLGKTPPETSLSFDDTAQYQYTGGTTGVAKGAVLTHGNLSIQVQQIQNWFPTFERGKEIMLGALPFFHVFGLSTSMNFAIFMGWTNILVPKPQPEPLLDTIAKFKPTFAPLVPTMYIGILNHPKIKTTDMTSIKGCFSGSAPLPLEVIREFEEKTGGTIVEGYGLTETSPVTHVNPFSGGKRKVGSIGVPISDTDARIVNLEDGLSPLSVGESGEIAIKGPQVMQGYLNKPDETAQVLKEGWFLTGDIAKMDEDGYFYIVDRKKDMIISGGYNIYPRDVEEVLYTHPKVLEATAIGLPHSHRGEMIKVYIVPQEGRELTEDEIREFCKDKLAKYKWPAEIEFRAELPKSNVGKILKKELRAEEMEKINRADT